MTELMLPVKAYHKIVRADGRLNYCLSLLEGAEAVPIRGEEFVVASVYNGVRSEICQDGSWLAGYDQIRLPNGDLLVTLPEQSVILENYREIVANHHTIAHLLDPAREHLTKKQLDALLERASNDLVKARESGVLRIPKHKISSEVPTNKYGEVIEPQFVYGTEAKMYGDFLHQNKIEFIEHYVGGSDPKRAVARGLWVRSLCNLHTFGGEHHDINYIHGRVFGIQNVPAEQTTPEVPQGKQVLEQRIH